LFIAACTGTCASTQGYPIGADNATVCKYIRIENISSKVTFNNTDVRSTAGVIASEYPGGYNIDQISEIYKSVKGGWRYVSDPRGPDNFNSADLTLRNGKEANSMGMGDCDDFAILMSALIEAIGGTTRIIFAYGPTGGHAYTEVYLGEAGDPQVDEMIGWLKDEYDAEDIRKNVTYPVGEVWLNLDWWVNHPGGEVYGTPGTEHCVIFIRNEDKTPPKMAPIIDAMDNTLGWRLCKDGIGSSINIESLPGRKGNAIEISYNLVEGGYVGISKMIDPKALKALSESDGVSFSCWGKGEPNTIELNLSYEDNTTFGYSWRRATASSDWMSRKAFYENFICSDLGDGCELYNDRLNPKNISTIEFIISNKPDENDVPGSGVLVIDQVRGIRFIAPGSPWALVEEMQQRDIALELASDSEQLRERHLTKSVLLSVESLKRCPTEEGDTELREGLSLLPRTIATLQHESSVHTAIFSPDGKHLATADDDHVVWVWDAITGRELCRMEQEKRIDAVVFSPDGTKLATANFNGTIRIWNVLDGEDFVQMEYGSRVNSVAFSPDGTKLAAGGDLGMRVWNGTTGEKVVGTSNVGGPVMDVIFSPDGTKVKGTFRIAASKSKQEDW